MKKIICFDVNGTIISGDIWDIFDDKETKRELDVVFEKFYNREISIAEMWDGMVKIFKKAGIADKKVIYDHWEKNNVFIEGTEELMNYLKGKDYRIYLISCSVDACLIPICKQLNIDGYFAGSRFVFDDNDELLRIESDCNGKPYKTLKIEELAKRESVNVEDIIFVGDGTNDIGAFKMTKHGIAINTDNKELIDNSWKQVKKLIEIKEIL